MKGTGISRSCSVSITTGMAGFWHDQAREMRLVARELLAPLLRWFTEG